MKFTPLNIYFTANVFTYFDTPSSLREQEMDLTGSGPCLLAAFGVKLCII